MLNSVNLAEIQGLLLRVPGLIHELQRRDASFFDSVKVWLTHGEEMLVNNRLTVAAGVAGLRGVLISAERGVVPPGLAFSARTTARKIKDAAAADVLRKAEELISAAISVDVARFAEGERVARQIVAVGERKGLTLAAAGASDHTEMLKETWEAMSRDPDLKSAAIHLVGLVGDRDVLVLLDRTLTCHTAGSRAVAAARMSAT